MALLHKKLPMKSKHESNQNLIIAFGRCVVLHFSIKHLTLYMPWMQLLHCNLFYQHFFFQPKIFVVDMHL